jgi:hypothetical protein
MAEKKYFDIMEIGGGKRVQQCAVCGTYSSPVLLSYKYNFLVHRGLCLHLLKAHDIYVDYKDCDVVKIGINLDINGHVRVFDAKGSQICLKVPREVAVGIIEISEAVNNSFCIGKMREFKDRLLKKFPELSESGYVRAL